MDFWGHDLRFVIYKSLTNTLKIWKPQMEQRPISVACVSCPDLIERRYIERTISLFSKSSHKATRMASGIPEDWLWGLPLELEKNQSLVDVISCTGCHGRTPVVCTRGQDTAKLELLTQIPPTFHLTFHSSVTSFLEQTFPAVLAKEIVSFLRPRTDESNKFPIGPTAQVLIVDLPCWNKDDEVRKRLVDFSFPPARRCCLNNGVAQAIDSSSDLTDMTRVCKSFDCLKKSRLIGKRSFECGHVQFLVYQFHQWDSTSSLQVLQNVH